MKPSATQSMVRINRLSFERFPNPATTRPVGMMCATPQAAVTRRQDRPTLHPWMPHWEHTAPRLLPSSCGSVSPPRGEGPSSRGTYQGLGNAKIVRFIPPTALPRSWVTSSSRGVHRARRRSTRTFRHFAEALHLVSVRHLPAADAATLLDGFGLTTPAAAPGVVVGGLALARSARRISNGGRRGGHRGPRGGADRHGHRRTVAAAEGGPGTGCPGTGYGIVGGFAGLTRDLIAAKRGAACRAWRAVRACPACRWPPSGRRARR